MNGKRIQWLKKNFTADELAEKIERHEEARDSYAELVNNGQGQWLSRLHETIEALADLRDAEAMLRTGHGYGYEYAS